MFNVLHHKSIPADPVGIDRLKTLAVMVNRNDCMRAMYYRAKCKILAMKNSKELCHLLWPAYAFDKAQFFMSLTKLMVLHLLYGQQIFNASEKYGFPMDIESHLPKGLIYIIYLVERESKREMQLQMEVLICPIAAKHAPSEYMSGSDEVFLSHCDCLSIAMLMNAMSDICNLLTRRSSGVQGTESL